MEYITIKIDGCFPSPKLQNFLNDGWIIIDKTLINNRYIYYVLSRDDGVGTCSGN